MISCWSLPSFMTVALKAYFAIITLSSQHLKHLSLFICSSYHTVVYIFWGHFDQNCLLEHKIGQRGDTTCDRLLSSGEVQWSAHWRSVFGCACAHDLRWHSTFCHARPPLLSVPVSTHCGENVIVYCILRSILDIFRYNIKCPVVLVYVYMVNLIIQPCFNKVD